MRLSTLRTILHRLTMILQWIEVFSNRMFQQPNILRKGDDIFQRSRKWLYHVKFIRQCFRTNLTKVGQLSRSKTSIPYQLLVTATGTSNLDTPHWALNLDLLEKMTHIRFTIQVFKILLLTKHVQNIIWPYILLKRLQKFIQIQNLKLRHKLQIKIKWYLKK